MATTNNLKYLDLAGLRKLKENRFIAPHPEKVAVNAGAYKVGTDEYGHIVLGDKLQASDFGVDNALHFIGISETDPMSAGGAQITGVTSFANGDICLYMRSSEDGYEEYIFVKPSTATTGSWELLGDADSYALKTIEIEGDGS